MPEPDIDLARRCAPAVGDIGTHFMIDAETYASAAARGYDGLDFYVRGRGGVLGEVPGDVVVAAFGYFAPDSVRSRWRDGAKVESAAEAADAFAASAHRWARTHIPDDFDCTRLVELAGRLVDSADGAGAPLFAGWRLLEVPDDAPAAAVHHMNALRELRGALHLGAVLGAGLTPREALMIKTPFMAEIFGWAAPHPEVDDARDAWTAAEAATDLALGRVLSALDPADGEAFATDALALRALVA